VDTIEVSPKISWGPSLLGGSTEYGYAGTVQVWSISYAGQHRWALYCSLPGIKRNVTVESQDAAKARAEKQLKAFLGLLGKDRAA
jgi:hypothetical protein